MKNIIVLLVISGMAFAGLSHARAQCDNDADPDIISCSGDYSATVVNDAINQGTNGNSGNENLTIESGSTVIMRTTDDGPVDDINIDTGNGDDTVTIGSNVSSSGGGDLRLGGGNDVILAEGDYTRRIRGQGDNDTITINGRSGEIYGGSGDDTITVTDSGRIKWGEDGNDLITVNGAISGSITIAGDRNGVGGAGDDTIIINGTVNVDFGVLGDHFSSTGTAVDAFGNDEITINGTANAVESDPNDDRIEQGGGTDTVIVTANGEVTGDINTRDAADVVTVSGTVGGNITTDGM